MFALASSLSTIDGSATFDTVELSPNWYVTTNPTEHNTTAGTFPVPKHTGDTFAINVGTIVMILLLGFVSFLGVVLLSWFLKRCCCRCFSQAGTTRDRRYRRNYFQGHDSRISSEEERYDLEEGHHQEEDWGSSSSSTIPSQITIPSSQDGAGDQRSPKRSNLSHGNRRRERRRRHRSRRSRRLHSSLFYNRQSTGRQTSSFDNEGSTILTASCDDASLVEEGSLSNASNLIGDRTPLFPNAMIQFRKPIHRLCFRREINQNNPGILSSDDLLRDFLVNTGDYIQYPLERLTILLRTRAPKTPRQVAELEDLREYVAALVATTHPTLAVEITTCTNDESLLRCAPTGGILVTFESVKELPRDHVDFLKDLIP